MFLRDFVTIIKNCNYSNTYKMMWAKALVEIALESDLDTHDNDIEITLEQIAHKALKYYFNHTMFFNLIQGSNPNKPPVIQTCANDLIKLVQDIRQSTQPIRFEKALPLIQNNPMYKSILKKTITTLKQDVSYRFIKLSGDTYDNLYSYKKGYNALIISNKNMQILKDYAFMLFDIINYRWALILETFNSSPRIAKKVKFNDETDLKRQSLKKYYHMIALDNPQKNCFICGEPIQGQPDIDHVIPWSYMYSDDIWNLVFTHKECNVSKSNNIPNEYDISKLQNRNNNLLKIMETQGETHKKVYHELSLANKENLVKKYWIGCQ